MKPTFLKKRTKGGAAGLSWEAGEVKTVNPALAEQLVMLAPEDYEVVKEGEHTPPPPPHNSPGFDMPVVSTDGKGIVVTQPETFNVEVVVKDEAEKDEDVEKVPELEPKPKPKTSTKRQSKATESPSAE